MSDLDRLAGRFEQIFAQPAQGIWFAPGRVNLIGEHTDYNDGFVLPFALEQRACIAAAKRNDRRVVFHSLELTKRHETNVDELEPKTTGWAAYLAGCMWALQQAGHELGGLNVMLSSNVPIGAGLSSSAAIECAMVTALVDLFELDIEPFDRAKFAQQAENEYVGAPTGFLDQAASTLCKKDQALFLDCRTFETKPVPLPLEQQGLEILVLDTKTPHSHVTGEYAARRQSCEQAAQELGVAALRDVEHLEALQNLNDPVLIKRARHVVSENQRVLEALQVAEAGDLRQLAPLLDASHASMRDDFEITCDTVDTAVSVARSAGALGARMTGGGFGGCIIALCEQDKGASIAEAIQEAFADKGFNQPEWFIATPSPGAGRIR